MAVYNFSALASGQSISFNPGVDVLNIDQSFVSAADEAGPQRPPMTQPDEQHDCEETTPLKEQRQHARDDQQEGSFDEREGAPRGLGVGDGLLLAGHRHEEVPLVPRQEQGQKQPDGGVRGEPPLVGKGAPRPYQPPRFA